MSGRARMIGATPNRAPRRLAPNSDASSAVALVAPMKSPRNPASASASGNRAVAPLANRRRVRSTAPSTGRSRPPAARGRATTGRPGGPRPRGPERRWPAGVAASARRPRRRAPGGRSGTRRQGCRPDEQEVLRTRPAGERRRGQPSEGSAQDDARGIQGKSRLAWRVSWTAPAIPQVTTIPPVQRTIMTSHVTR